MGSFLVLHQRQRTLEEYVLFAFPGSPPLSSQGLICLATRDDEYGTAQLVGKLEMRYKTYS